MSGVIPQRIDIYHHVVTAPDPRMDQVLGLLAHIIAQGVKTMATLADVTAAVAAEKTVEDSVIALLGQLSDDLKAAIAGNDPAALQAVVDQINTNAAALAAAVAANTPADPTPTP